MYQICSQECTQFFEEYNKFLHHYEKSLLFCVIIRTSKSKNAQVALLYERAVEEHIAATNACLQLHAIYRQLVQKWLETPEKEL